MARLAPAVFSARTYFGLSAVDVNGRLGDRRMVQHLGWAAGTRLNIREDHGLIIVVADPQGVFAVTDQGFVFLPMSVRRWCRLRGGDRVLVVAEPDAGWVVIHPPAVLAGMVASVHQAVWAGETR